MNFYNLVFNTFLKKKEYGWIFYRTRDFLNIELLSVGTLPSIRVLVRNFAHIRENMRAFYKKISNFLKKNIFL